METISNHTASPSSFTRPCSPSAPISASLLGWFRVVDPYTCYTMKGLNHAAIRYTWIVEERNFLGFYRNEVEAFTSPLFVHLGRRVVSWQGKWWTLNEEGHIVSQAWGCKLLHPSGAV